MDVFEYINRFSYGTKDLSLKAMKYFLDLYGNFDKSMKFIHVAGTNGKGSCVEMLNSILIKQGYKVGKYISPYLVKFNEVISINNQDITDESLTKLITKLDPQIKEYESLYNTKMTLFELKTILALIYFYQENVDIVILEVGIGGKYDCTNIITNTLVSIISSIGYDHMNLLGNTLEEITTQKAGIIKESSHTVCFSQSKEIDDIIINTCKNLNNHLHMLKESELSNYHIDHDFQSFNFSKYQNILVNLKGQVQIKNAAICITTIEILRELGFKINDKAIYDGLSSVVHHGRMETLNKNPLVIYDGAHNEQAIKNLQNTINMQYSKAKKIYIISILKRKDYSSMLKLLSNDQEAIYIFTSGNDFKEYTPKEILYQEALKYLPKERLLVLELPEAIKYLKNKSNYITFVIGSFYVYKDVVYLIDKYLK